MAVAPHAYKDRFVACTFEVFQREMRTEGFSVEDFYTKLFYLSHFLPNNIAREAIIRNADGCHSTGFGKHLEDRHFITLLCEEGRAGEPRRACADDGNPW